VSSVPGREADGNTLRISYGSVEEALQATTRIGSTRYDYGNYDLLLVDVAIWLYFPWILWWRLRCAPVSIRLRNH